MARYVRLGSYYGGVTETVNEAERIAANLLADDLPRRWQHVKSVARKAVQVSRVLELSDGASLIAAAWLHDIGYASGLVMTGFHPLDGARWLRSRSFDSRVAALVAHHSCAAIEADERGLLDILTCEFEHEQSATSDALIYCDMTTGPTGRSMDVGDRLSEIRSRYGPEHVVTRFATRAESRIIEAARRIEGKLSVADTVGPV